MISLRHLRATTIVAAAIIVLDCRRSESRQERAQQDTPVPSPPAPYDSTTLEVPASRPGLLGMVVGKLTFTICDSARQIVLRDTPHGDGAALVRELGQGNGRVLALLQLDSGQLRDIRYAAPEHRGCQDFPPQGVVEARGNEPFWAVQVFGDTALVRVPLNPSGFRFRDGRWRRPTAGEWVYEARRLESGTEEFLLLRLKESRCSDGMSDTRYPFRAELIRDGNPASGCAVEGRSAVRR